MFELMDAYSQSAVIKVIGVGGGGGNAVEGHTGAVGAGEDLRGLVVFGQGVEGAGADVDVWEGLVFGDGEFLLGVGWLDVPVFAALMTKTRREALMMSGRTLMPARVMAIT